MKSYKCKYTLNGKEVRGVEYRHSRGGTLPPTLTIIELENVRYTPYKARRAGITVSLSQLLYNTYGQALELMSRRFGKSNLVHSLFLNTVKDFCAGSPYVVPTKGY